MTMPEFDPTGIKGMSRELGKLVSHLEGAGCKINEYPSSIRELDTTVERILEENCQRVSWYLFNLSSNTIYVAFSNKPSSTYGIPLATKCFLQFSADEDPGIPPKEVWACASANDSVIYLFEVVK